MKTLLPLAIVSAFTGICSLLGMVPGAIAVVLLVRANNFHVEGDLARAQKAVKAARILAWSAMAINIPFTLWIAIAG